MQNYKNGPKEITPIPRMSDSTFHCLIRDSLFRDFAHQYEGENLDRLHGLMHDVAEETLARVSVIAPPVAAGSVDTPEFEKLMVRWSTAGGGRFGLHEQGIPELRAKIVEHINAWGAQQQAHGEKKATYSMEKFFQVKHGLIERAEKAEAELKARDFFVDVLNCQVKKAQGEADVLFHRLNAANGHLAMARERIGELETEIKVLHRG